MMSLVNTVDYITLPQALLAPFKRHQRIDHCDDDELIAELLQGSIEQFERNSEISVFASQVELYPESGDFLDGKACLEVTPVNSIAITAPPAGGGAPVPVDASYRIMSKGMHGIRIYYLVGAWTDGLTLAIETGYAPLSLPPEVRHEIFRLTGHVYEYREIYLPNGIQDQPEWKTDIVAGFWKPRL